MTKQIIVKDGDSTGPAGPVSDFALGFLGAASEAEARNRLGVDLAAAETAVQPEDLNNVATSGNAEDLAEGATKKLMTLAERDKLGSVAAQATQNETDTHLLDRENHTGVQPISSVDDLQAELDRGARGDQARAETVGAFTSDLTGAPEARLALSVGSVVTTDEDGAVLRIDGNDYEGSIDVAPRRSWAVEDGRVYELRCAFRRLTDPTDPSGHAVDLRVQTLNKNKAALSNVVVHAWAGPSATVADGRLSATLTLGRGGDVDYQVPATCRYVTPHLRIYGDEHAVGLDLIDLVDVTAQATLGALAGKDTAEEGDLGDGAVSNVKLANVNSGTLKGRQTADPGVPEDLTPAQARALLNIAEGATANQPADEAAARLGLNAEDMLVPSTLLAAVESALTRSPVLRDLFADLFRIGGQDGTVVQSADGRQLMGFDGAGRLQINGALAPYFLAQDPSTHELHLVNIGEGPDIPLTLAVDMRSGMLRLGRLKRESLLANRQAMQDGAVIDTGQLAATLAYGQSNSIGGGHDFHKFPPGTAAQPVHDHPISSRMHMFAPAGLIGREFNAMSAPEFADLAPARERWKLPRGLGQSGGVSHMRMSERLRLDQGGDTTAFADHQLYFSAGDGGENIGALSKGTTPYANLLLAVAELKARAHDYQLAPVLRGIRFVHGEQDREDENATYQADLIQLATDIDADCRAALGQSDPVRLYVAQLSTKSNTASPTLAGPVAQAMLEASLASDLIVLTGPTYHLARVDSVHFTAKGQDLMAERDAWVQHQVEIAGVSWQPCRPVAISRAGTTITVSVHVPNGDLVADTDRLPEAANWGFDYTGANITDVQITSAAGPTASVRITLDADAPGDLSYAQDGPGVAIANGVRPHAGGWGNLRDGGGAEVPSVTHPGELIANWLVTFTETVA